MKIWYLDRLWLIHVLYSFNLTCFHGGETKYIGFDKPGAMLTQQNIITVCSRFQSDKLLSHRFRPCTFLSKSFSVLLLEEVDGISKQKKGVIRECQCVFSVH